jgi:hypothetical protein
MSYIERDGILKDLQEELELDSLYYNDDVNKGITEGLNMAIKHIKRFPTADVAPIADTVRKMQELFNERVGNRFSYHGWYLKETIFTEIAKEILEGKDDNT